MHVVSIQTTHPSHHLRPLVLDSIRVIARIHHQSVERLDTSSFGFLSVVKEKGYLLFKLKLIHVTEPFF